MLFDKLAAVSVSCANRAVIWALRRRIAAFREAWREISFNVPEEIFLLKTEPEIIVIICNSRAAIGGVWRAISVENLAHDKVSASAIRVWIDCDRLQEAV